MQFVANYEIKSEGSVVADAQVLRIVHPKGRFRARIENIPRSVFTTPFLLSLHLYFEAPSLKECRDVADEMLVECLNMLALTTSSAFQRHRIRQIVDATPQAAGMRDVLMWSAQIEYEDPQPMLSEETVDAVNRLLQVDLPPAIHKAMRWYRLGINATIPDDQFINFWFALEIVAEHRKSTDKVPSKCPKCQAALYCEASGEHPTHKPYPKQAIRSLVDAVGKDFAEGTFELLDKTRNSLMHGATLKDIENELPEPHEQIVDVLGKMLWRALLDQFPKELFAETMALGVPTTYVHRNLNTILHMQTVVPMLPDGDFNLRFAGTTAEIVPNGPPQSALPSVIGMTLAQHDRLARLAMTKGEHQAMCRRIHEKSRIRGEEVRALVLSTDMEAIRAMAASAKSGDSEGLFREIFAFGPSS